MRETITNFSRGEFGPELYGRVDVPQYSAGARRLRNFIIQRYGGVAFRPGMRIVHEVDDVTKDYRLLPFSYSIDQTYVLLLGDSKMRVLANGGAVLEEDLKILGATLANPCVLNIPFHALSVGDRVYIDGLTGMPQLNGREAKVTAVPDASNVAININSSAFAALTDSTGITRSAAPAAPPTPEAPPAAPPPPPAPPPTGNPSSGTVAPRYPKGIGFYDGSSPYEPI